MGLFDMFKRKPEPADPTRDLVLSKLKVGYFLDYELDSFEVTAHHRYDIGDDGEIEEWALDSGKQTYFLERFEDDDVVWSLARKIPIGAIDGDIRGHIHEHDDPPERIVYKDETYYLEDSDAGYFYENCKGSGDEFISWTYVDDSQKRFVTIEQWGENEFEAAAGDYVAEYQFTNILPGQGSS